MTSVAPKPTTVSVGGTAVSLEVAATFMSPVSALYVTLVRVTWSVTVTIYCRRWSVRCVGESTFAGGWRR